MSVDTYTKSGVKAATAAKLEKSVFSVIPENLELIKLAYEAYMANGRENLARTKTRGLIRGGGRKPWRQKGTGRARFGSSRNPIWRGGGIAFGPTGEENYTVKLPTATKRQAIRQALSMAADEGRIKVIEGLESKDGKVAPMVALLDKLGATGNILLADSAKDPMVLRATRNISDVQVVNARYLNVFDLLNSDTIVVTKAGLEEITAWLGGKK